MHDKDWSACQKRFRKAISDSSCLSSQGLSAGRWREKEYPKATTVQKSGTGKAKPDKQRNIQVKRLH